VKLDYKHYLKRVADIVAEPMPDDPSQSIAPWSEVWLDYSLESQESIDGAMIPGYKFFNNALRGFRPHEFTILCGPTGVGKTTTLANLAVQLSLGNVPVFVGSVETGKTDFHRVMAGIFAGRDPYSAWTPDELKALGAAHGVHLKSKRNVYCRYDSRVPHRRLLADLLWAVENLGTKVALVDNLNFLMEIKGAKDQITEMDKAVHDFVVFVKKVPLHVVMVMHPRKTENGRVESEFDIKGSSTAVQEAANVILWNRLANESDAPMTAKPEYCREMKFCKVRKNGRSVGARIIFSLDTVSPKLSEARLM
jgi:energy-coupling factor transporter ATP-binding protein EcfA2